VRRRFCLFASVARKGMVEMVEMVEKLGKNLLSFQIRQSFLKYFEDHGHTVVPSSSLVPLGDPTLLFTNAGMNQFKDVFLGLDKRSYKRATTCQKCVRAGGKHNDLDNVGFTKRHHTFFEMLGNFSFGDYFKEDAIEYAWDFLTKVLELPKNRLYVTIFKDDDVAEALWKKIAGLSSDRIVRLGEKDNFWAMGETGPCGPCSEIIIDRGEDLRCGPSCGIGTCDCDRWLELWNLVFMQYLRDEAGKLLPLPRPSIDTGMGLERISSVLEGTDSNFETDLFWPIIEEVERVSGRSAGKDAPVFPFRVISDHIRACVFLAQDGVHPSNEGRGYVMRRILRRAVRFGRVLGIQEPFMERLVPVVGDIMGGAYPELREREGYIKEVLRRDEVRFLNTLEEGQKRAEEMIERTRKEGRAVFSGEDAFLLYDTFGFPIDLTKDMAREHGLSVDERSFEKAMEEQREKSRRAKRKGLQDILELHDLIEGFPPTQFTGYASLEERCKVLGIISDGSRVTEMEPGDKALLVLDVTPFYAVSGGQEADFGVLEFPAGAGEVGRPVGSVEDVTKTPEGVFLHKVKTSRHGIMVGQTLLARVDVKRRRGLERHHTATHLLHQALRRILGEHVQQSGSLVEEGRLRFDFSHFKALSQDELDKIEDLINGVIMEDLPVVVSTMSLEEARRGGAIALFGEKYGETVRVVEIQGFSKELCGGTHVRRTGEIGQFQIVSESAVAAGTRRILAVAGETALSRVRALSRTISSLSEKLGVAPEEVSSRIDQLHDTISALEKEIASFRQGRKEDVVRELLEKAINLEEAGNRKVVVSRLNSMSIDELRSLGDRLRERGISVVILGSSQGERGFLLVMVDQESMALGVDASEIVKKGAALMGGSGGGKKHMAQAGGKNPERLEEALKASFEEAKKHLTRRFGS